MSDEEVEKLVSQFTRSEPSGARVVQLVTTAQAVPRPPPQSVPDAPPVASVTEPAEPEAVSPSALALPARMQNRFLALVTAPAVEAKPEPEPEELAQAEPQPQPMPQPKAEPKAPRPADEAQIFVDVDAPYEVARCFVLSRYSRGNGPTLHYWRGGWLRWTGTHYAEMEDDALRSDTASISD
jgi:hypothetical protein